MLFNSTELDAMHRELNKSENIPEMGFRRNVRVYELICYINNIIGCYLGKNAETIPIFIGRSRSHMEKYPAGDSLTKEVSKNNLYDYKRNSSCCGAIL
ncbi:MAG: hypothetical protein D3910_08885 [Candidatus Electrothrix sp. ATG2]|nr:hypothetical protein [Candidatus Electrothrix sp. ATG2]